MKVRGAWAGEGANWDLGDGQRIGRTGSRWRLDRSGDGANSRATGS